MKDRKRVPTKEEELIKDVNHYKAVLQAVKDGDKKLFINLNDSDEEDAINDMAMIKIVDIVLKNAIFLGIKKLIPDLFNGNEEEFEMIKIIYPKQFKGMLLKNKQDE